LRHASKNKIGFATLLNMDSSLIAHCKQNLMCALDGINNIILIAQVVRNNNRHHQERSQTLNHSSLTPFQQQIQANDSQVTSKLV